MVVALSSAINLPNHSPKFPAPQNNTAVGLNGHESVSSVGAPAMQRNRTLTFADRVAYQRAIEEVYWRHRTWPKENAGTKPPLDKVMSQAEIEKKVEDYLRNSQALEDYWQRPITPDQLQAEMERIASHTKQPGVLREIFAALGNDPFVIAECLARPVLAERLITELYAHDQRFHGELKRRAEADLAAHHSVKQMKQASGTYGEVELLRSDNEEIVGQAPCLPKEQLAGGAPALQRQHSATGVKLTSREWNENVQKLSAIFGDGDAVPAELALRDSRTGVPPAQHEKVGAIDLNRLGGSGEPPVPQKGVSIAQIKTGVLSPLQENEGHYYAVAVMKKGKDRLKLATIAWLKEPLRSWLAKAETEVPLTRAAVSSTNYTLPVISSPSGSCTDDTWTRALRATRWMLARTIRDSTTAIRTSKTVSSPPSRPT